MSKESEDDAGTSGLMETSMMEGEDYYNPEESEQWTDGVASSQLCRICATTNEYLIPIFDGEGLEHQLGMKIEKHLPIQVKQGDKLPLQVCYQCASTLIAWHDLVIGCVNAEKKLLQLREQELLKEQDSDDNYDDDDMKTVELLQDPLEDLSVPSTSKAEVPVKKPAIRSRLRSKKSDSVIQPKIEVSDPETSEPTERSPLSSSFKAFHQSQYRLRKVLHKITPNVCVACNKSFLSRSDLRRHTRIHVAKKPVGRRGTTYLCQECGKKFTLKDSYIRHMRVHTGERPFTCHVCGKQFRDSGGLARHLKDVHAGIKNFACELCGRCFASKATRDDHTRIHTGERPYVCHLCGKAFKSKASLYTHGRIHTDSFPHPCTYCDKRFRRRQELLAHVTTHTGEKPHVCEVCTRCFRVRGELLRHKLIHSDDKPFVCSSCGLSFRQKRYLRNHEKSRHPSVQNYL